MMSKTWNININHVIILLIGSLNLKRYSKLYKSHKKGKMT